MTDPAEKSEESSPPEQPVPTAELPIFTAREAYVYQIPPATTVGHRAELWNVNKWFAEVGVRVVAADEHCAVRLEDLQSRELFAECPILPDRPLTTAVEPVIDSSRYFVLRIEDAASKRHAFIGLGFRERAAASDFNAALHEHQQYVKRKRLAEAQRAAYEERERAASESGESAGDGAGAAPPPDLSLKPGESLHLRIRSAGAISVDRRTGAASGFVSGRAGLLRKQFSLILDGALAPPPSGRRSGSGDLPMAVSPAASSSSGGRGGVLEGGSSSEDEAVTSHLRAMQLSGAEESVATAGGGGGKGGPDGGDAGGTAVLAGGKEAGSSGAAGDAAEDDEFGEFVS